MKRLLSLFLVVAFILTNQAFALGLEDLIKRAEENDYKLLSLLHRVKAGKYRVEQVKAQYRPQVSFTTYYGWQEYKPYYSDEVRQLLKYYYLSLKQPIYRPEILAKLKQTKLYSEVDSLRVLQERQYARYLLVTNLIHLAYSKRKKALYSELLSLEEKRLIEAKELQEKELLPVDSLMEIEKSYEEARFGLREANLEIQSISSNLALLIGDWGEEQPFLLLDVPLTTLYARGEKLKRDINQNLEVKIAKKNVEIAKSEIEVRKYGRYPKVDLSLSYSYTSSSAISVASRDKRAAIIIEIPLYQGGYLTAQKLEAEELRKAVEAEVKAVLKEKELQFEDSLNRLEQAAEKLKYLQKRLEKDEEILEVVRQGVERRLKTVFDLLEQKRKVINDRLLILEEVYTGLLAYVELLYLSANLDLSNLEIVNSSLEWLAE